MPATSTLRRAGLRRFDRLFVGMDPPNGSFMTRSILPVFPLVVVSGGGAADQEAPGMLASRQHRGSRVWALDSSCEDFNISIIPS